MALSPGNSMYQACQRSDVIDGGVEEDVKEVLRGHVWMTMTNGLCVLLSEKAWRLQPLAMPCPWREEGRTMTVEDKKEMLHNSFASHPVCQGACLGGIEKGDLGRARRRGGLLGSRTTSRKVNCLTTRRLTCRSRKKILSTCAYFAEMLC
jgi:hypothetical protein